MSLRDFGIMCPLQGPFDHGNTAFHGKQPVCAVGSRFSGLAIDALSPEGQGGVRDGISLRKIDGPFLHNIINIVVYPVRLMIRLSQRQSRK